ncbi:hypothetical protein ACJJTC_013697 [Scirpophaga incertulas]
MWLFYFVFVLSLGIFTKVSTSVIEGAEILETSARIVNGYAVPITEVPYQAALGIRRHSGWAHICGASIISSKSLLTAAHCAVNYVSQPSTIVAAVGTATRNSGGTTYAVSRFVLHEQYSELTLEHDIALAAVSQDIVFSAGVATVPVAPAGYIVPTNAEALVSGFGVISHGGAASSKLLAAKVKVVNHTTCILSYLKNNVVITPGMLCASGTNPARDACQGDSGGPLVYNNYLIGIVSSGEGCAEVEFPGIYTKVSNYEAWIKKNVV